MIHPPVKIPGVCFEHLIGTGGMSEVWLAYHGGLDKEVAIKVMSREAAVNGEDIRQFMLESRVMENIRHPNIVHSYEADCRDGRYYFVMDYVSGYTFAMLLVHKKRISQEDALVVLDSVAQALSFAWKKHSVVHCDLKPDNLMVDGDGLVKITDMGLCQCLGMQGVGLSEQGKEIVVGTPAYMSPEQIYGDRDIDPRSDIYCMGATLYHLVSGRVLFPDLDNDDTLRAHIDMTVSAPNPADFNPELSPGFVRMLVKMCAKDKDFRYADWDAVLADSRLVLSGGMPEPLCEGAVSSIAE